MKRTEWLCIVVTLLLLTAGKVKFRRIGPQQG